MADSIPQPGSPVIWTTSIPICTSTLHVMYVWYWYVVKLCLSFQKKKNFAWLCCSYLNIWSTACISLLCEGQCTLAFIPRFLLLRQAGCHCIDWRLQMNSICELKEMDSDPTRTCCISGGSVVDLDSCVARPCFECWPALKPELRR